MRYEPSHLHCHTLGLECSSSSTKSSCTFGDTALIQGQLQYSGVEELELENNATAYLAGEFDVSVDLLVIPNGMSVDLCYDETVYITPIDNTTTCPGDGVYDFEAALELPDYGTSWLATGWLDSGTLELFSDSSLSTVIGSCTIDYKTSITSKSRYFYAPSAFTTLFVVGGVALLGATWACYYITCVYKSKRRYKGEEEGDDDDKNDKNDNTNTYSWWSRPNDIVDQQYREKNGGNDKSRDNNDTNTYPWWSRPNDIVDHWWNHADDAASLTETDSTGDFSTEQSPKKWKFMVLNSSGEQIKIGDVSSTKQRNEKDGSGSKDFKKGNWRLLNMVGKRGRLKKNNSTNATTASPATKRHESDTESGDNKWRFHDCEPPHEEEAAVPSKKSLAKAAASFAEDLSCDSGTAGTLSTEGDVYAGEDATESVSSWLAHALGMEPNDESSAENRGTIPAITSAKSYESGANARRALEDGSVEVADEASLYSGDTSTQHSGDTSTVESATPSLPSIAQLSASFSMLSAPTLPSESATSTSSNSALRYLETNQVPDNEMVGMVGRSAWNSGDTGETKSTPLVSPNAKERRGFTTKFRQFSKSVSKKAASMSKGGEDASYEQYNEDNKMSFFQDKSSPIAWESAKPTEYQQFDL